MSKQDEAFWFLGNTYRHLYPETVSKSERERLISKGLLIPITDRATLKMDDLAFERAAEHIAGYYRKVEDHVTYKSPDPAEEVWMQDRRVMP